MLNTNPKYLRRTDNTSAKKITIYGTQLCKQWTASSFLHFLLQIFHLFLFSFLSHPGTVLMASKKG